MARLVKLRMGKVRDPDISSIHIYIHVHMYTRENTYHSHIQIHKP